MKKIGTIYALTAMAVAGIHFEPGDVVRGEGIDDVEKGKLLRQRQVTEDKAEAQPLIDQRKERDAARAAAEQAEEAERQAEIEETIRPSVERIVGPMIAAAVAKALAAAKPAKPEKPEGKAQGS